LIGFALIAYPAFYFFTTGKQLVKVTLAVIIGFYVVIFYVFNYRLLADQMFLQPKHVAFLDSRENKVLPTQLVLGVTINSESKAYPIEVIGYHHQVRDVVGGEPIMVTYCTVCRTGRVYSPVVAGKEETFRLVGMDHYNAMFEDKQTGSWWRQVSGEAVMGPLKGTLLKEITSQQMSLTEWLEEYPSSTILQPDSTFKEAYKDLSDYDEGKRTGRLERKDSLSWRDKSWVVGIQLGKEARAYDWNDLQKLKAINDVIDQVPVVLVTSADRISFHAFSRIVMGDTLSFVVWENGLEDTTTQSIWNRNGMCVEGKMKGVRLSDIQSYQEYWHSWRTFHPQSTRYEP
jgi:hypothetical protein